MRLVKVIPKSKRSKERVMRHGAEMTVCRELPNKVLLESLNDTWHGEKWKGWFTEEEATVQEIDTCEKVRQVSE